MGEWVLRSVAAILTLPTAFWAIWCTVIAFRGGTLPLLAAHLPGNLLLGIIWALFVLPLSVALAGWLAVVLITPVRRLLQRRASPFAE